MGSNLLRTALVTGSAVRLGREIALNLAARGWQIAVHYNTSKSEAEQTVKDCEALGVLAAAFQADLATPESIPSLYSAIGAKLGPLTGLVNSAAIFNRDHLMEMTIEGWHAHQNTNLLAPILLTQHFAHQLPKDERGSVVNLVDGCEGLCLSPNFFSYSISKYALMDATRLMAASLAPHIRVNAIGPGLTLPKEGEEEMFARLVEKTLLKIATSPKSIADSVAFLMEQESITGQVLMLDGGAALHTLTASPLARKDR